MARILAMSSQVVSGHVGLSAIQPALQVLGHEVLALPTILLSNHPGRQPASGTRIEPALLEQMLETLANNGRLRGIDHVLTGYLPSVAHVAVAIRALELCAHHGGKPHFLCDPVLGDDPKGLYIDVEAAAAIRDRLVPLADVLTPNRFELAWLTSAPVNDRESAITAARMLERPWVIATSIPMGTAQLATLGITSSEVHTQLVARREGVPNGTGDLLAALVVAAVSDLGFTIAHALAQAVAQVDQVIANSAGNDELQLIATLAQWRKTAPSAMDSGKIHAG